jgi:predicted O-linked N-acetylglucosamine transferase (SPINDLY family)
MTQQTARTPTNPQIAATINALLQQAVKWHQQGHLQQAEALYRQVLDLDVANFDALHLSGVIAAQNRDYEQAVELLNRAISINPNSSEAFLNLGIAAQQIFEYSLAAQCYQHAVSLNSGYLDAYVHLGDMLQELHQYPQALAAYDQAMFIDPNHDFLAGIRLHLKRKMCDWRENKQDINHIKNRLETGDITSPPFMVLTFLDSPELQRKAAVAWVNNRYANLLPGIPAAPRYQRHERIRIGYFSPDFREHAVSYLTAELFEKHDKRHFELYAFVYGPDKQDALQQRIHAAFERVIDIRELSDGGTVKLARELEIDIAIDMAGFTANNRTEIFYLRAAPIQVSYLGYPATHGKNYMDYLIADEIIIPAQYRGEYSEKIIYLPCFQVNDSHRNIASCKFSRKDMHLPEEAFVFCCFNNQYKITPELFTIWMSILDAVPQSVLWLLAETETVEVNLKRYAQNAGIDDARLIFAPRVSREDYHARFQLADLFLDTLPYNAGTTASDALWCGLPVLTCAGASYVSRMAASLLTTVGLPDLITNDLTAYRAKAIALGNNPLATIALKQRLDANRDQSLLFDSSTFTQNLEQAYQQIYQRYQLAKSGQDIHVGEMRAPVQILTAQSADDAQHFFATGNQMQQQKEYANAAIAYQKALELQPDFAEAAWKCGNAYQNQGDFESALPYYRKAITCKPDYAQAYNNMAVALQALQRYDEALDAIDRAIDLKPDYASAYNNRGLVLKDMEQPIEEQAAYRQAIAIDPEFIQAHNNLGNSLRRQEQYQEALSCFEIVLNKTHTPEVFCNYGLVLWNLKRYQEALAAQDQAIALKPNYANAWTQKGQALGSLKREQEAIECFNRALQINPNFAEAYNGLGLAYHSQKNYQSAAEHLKRSTQLKPDVVPYWINYGHTLKELKEYQAEIECYQQALAINPHHDFLLGEYYQAKRQTCDWHNLQEINSDFKQQIRQGKKTSSPFTVLALTDDASLQHQAAEVWGNDQIKNLPDYPALNPYPEHQKIRIGYFSSDFRNHPVAFLTAELFEKHDRERFEIIAFSYCDSSENFMRQRLIEGFDAFHDVADYEASKIVDLARSLEIDIAIDLSGYTNDSRIGMFAMRVAPLQIGYLGYVGTSAMPFMDYIIADTITIPESDRQNYSEKIIYLPCYQPNDTQRTISDVQYSRADLGLPEQGFVFCCFNNSYKITPEMFDSWIRILQAVSGSVLLMFVDNPQAELNLKTYFIRSGMDGDRLVFVKRLPIPEYLARYRTADLFLDCLPYNGGTTTSDALWAGLPVLTCAGQAYAARMAASLVSAAGLPELVTHNLVEYEAKAIQLASNPQLMAQLRSRLAAERKTSKLFDIALFTSHLEQAYLEIHKRQRQGLPPEHVFTQPQDAKHQQAQDLLEQGNQLQSDKQYQQAIACYEQAVSLQPQFAEAWWKMGNAWQNLGKIENSLHPYSMAIAAKSDYYQAYNNYGIALQSLKRFQEALESFDSAIAYNSDYAPAWNNRGLVLKDLRQTPHDLKCFEQAVALKPDYLDAINNLALTLQRLQRHEEAADNFRKALSLNNRNAKIHYNFANTLHSLKEYHQELQHLEIAMQLQPDYAFVYSQWLATKMQICDWRTFDQDLLELKLRIQRGEKACNPFLALTCFDDPALQLRAATIWGQDKTEKQQIANQLPAYQSHDKIRVGYFSSDFHSHPVSQLTAGIFEHHDKTRFEIIAFSMGPQHDTDPLRARLQSAFDEFIDVSQEIDQTIQEMARAREIDIAVDLTGYTNDSRTTALFAQRLAPVQIGYIGYIGTLGMPFLDYLIADSVTIPETQTQYYAEKIIRLPSYQANDSRREIADICFTRSQLALPENGFVFCSFNNAYKITPQLFECWMNILKAVPDSVLWLYTDNSAARINLGNSAAAHGIGSERLIFAGQMPKPEYMARYRNADLFLDSVPYNAGTTASDALWAGLPVLTCAGNSFVSRMAASLLQALDLQELITTDLIAYQETAIKLATHSSILTGLKQKLAVNRWRQPLYNIAGFTRNLEQAFIQAHISGLNNLPPQHITVDLPYDPDWREAFKHCDNVVAANPATLEIRAQELYQLGYYQLAAACCQDLLEQQPDNHKIYHNLGLALHKLHRYSEALQNFDQGFNINPERQEAYLNNRGMSLSELGRYDDAMSNFDRAIALKPDYLEALINRARTLQKLKHFDSALQDYDRIIELKPDFAEVYANRATLFNSLKRYQHSIDSYDQALTLNPQLPYLHGFRFNNLMQVCDWRNYQTDLTYLISKAGKGEKVLDPFTALASIDDPALHFQVAQLWQREHNTHLLPKPQRPMHAEHKRIKIAYFSADFNQHPVAYLTAELFERHNRQHFEVIAFSMGADTDNPYRNRLKAAFDQFIDVRLFSDQAVVDLAVNMEVDIAIDLGGYTTDNRFMIFAHRLAPIQVSYIGYLGTLGANYMDYILADDIIVTSRNRPYFTESVVYLPCFQVNDSKRQISEHRYTRQELGLPEQGFVFCSFNNTYKITPNTFDSWMRILKAVPDSVLLLYSENPLAKQNLLTEARQRGVADNRLVFAETLPLPDYLARYRTADLFLDSLPYNAGTTASDALWAGLPVLTQCGHSYASRMASSLLNNIGLPELITHSVAEYETLAIQLATNSAQMTALKQKLQLNRYSKPLFNIQAFTDNLEQAYRRMYRRYLNGQSPTDLFAPFIE